MGPQALPSIAIPGQRLGETSSYIAGPGTHVQENFICASIAGPVVIRTPKPSSDPKRKQRDTLTISRRPAPAPHAPDSDRPHLPPQKPTTEPEPTALTTRKKKSRFNTLPTVESVVLGRVTRVQKRQATISIILVLDKTDSSAETALHDPEISTILASTTDASPTSATTSSADDLRFQALIRKEDVRAVEKDRVVMEDMFRVGDIVRAVIISMGDQSSYYASTAGNEYGVIMARSSGEGGGNMMHPVSWKEMRDPVTGTGELRKVAKPF